MSEAEAFTALEDSLRRRLHRFACPSPHALGEYALGLLPPEKTLAVAGHAADCPRCADELRTLRTFLATEPEAEPGPIERLRRVVARLVAPSPDLAYAGLRGGGDAGSATYHVGATTIILSPEPTARRGRVALVGLLVREDGAVTAGRQARLTADAGQTLIATIDDLGNFAFDDLPAGSYRLEIGMDEELVTIEDLRVGS